MEALRLHHPCHRNSRRKFSRRQTGKWEWEDARAVVAVLEKAGRWDETVIQTPPALPKNPEQHTTIAEATEAFLAKCPNRGIQPTTFAKYQTFTNQLKAFANSRGYVYVDQLTVADMDRF